MKTVTAIALILLLFAIILRAFPPEKDEQWGSSWSWDDECYVVEIPDCPE